MKISIGYRICAVLMAMTLLTFGMCLPVFAEEPAWALNLSFNNQSKTPSDANSTMTVGVRKYDKDIAGIDVATAGSDYEGAPADGDYAFGWQSTVNGTTVDRNNGRGLKFTNSNLTAASTATVVMRYDFKLDNVTDVITCLGALQGNSRYYRMSLYVIDGKLYYSTAQTSATVTLIENTEVKANIWNRIGIVWTSDTSTGKTMDVYYNDAKVASVTSTNKEAINCMSISHLAETADYANCRIYIDNLYMGTDMMQVLPNLKVESVTPANGTTKVPVTPEISVAFTTELDPSSVTAGAFALTDAEGTTVTLKAPVLSGNGKSVTLSPVDALAFSTEYVLTVKNSLKSKDGKALTAETTSNFYTRGNMDIDLEVTEVDGVVTAALTDQTGESPAGYVYAAAYTQDEAGIMMRDMRETAIAWNAGACTVIEDFSDVLVAYPEALIKVFVLDSLSAGNLLAEPYWKGSLPGTAWEETPSAVVNGMDITDGIVTATGAVTPNGVWTMCYLTKANKNVHSAAVGDYLMVEPVYSDAETGAVIVTGAADAPAGTEGTYTCKLKPLGGDSVIDSLSYTIQNGCDILTMSLNNYAVTVGNNTLTTKVASSENVTGMLMTFALSERAKLYQDTTELVSGTSRINCSSAQTLTVVAENGETKTYTLTVSKSGSSGGGGGSSFSGGGFSGGSSVNTSVGISGGAVSVPPTTNVQEEIPVVEEVEEARFTDVAEEHWAFEAVQALAEKDVLSGVGNGKFEPEAPVTREAFVTMLARAFTFSAQPESVAFTDAEEGAWYTDAVNTLAACEIIRGYADGSFGVGQMISRQDMAVLILRVADYLDINLDVTRAFETFADQAVIADYAAEAVEVLYQSGIVNGMGDGSFAPENSVTRAEASCIIYRILQ